MPVSSMSGDNIAPEVARLKGEIEAVHQASIEKNAADDPAFKFWQMTVRSACIAWCFLLASLVPGAADPEIRTTGPHP